MKVKTRARVVSLRKSPSTTPNSTLRRAGQQIAKRHIHTNGRGRQRVQHHEAILRHQQQPCRVERIHREPR